MHNPDSGAHAPPLESRATTVTLARQSPELFPDAVMVSSYAISTYVHASPKAHIDFGYSRSQAPTRVPHERGIAAIEYGVCGLAVFSGMALNSTALDLLSADNAGHGINRRTWSQ